MKITIEHLNRTIIIEDEAEALTDVLSKLIIPMLLALRYSPDTIKELFEEL